MNLFEIFYVQKYVGGVFTVEYYPERRMQWIKYITDCRLDDPWNEVNDILSVWYYIDYAGGMLG